VARVTLDPRHEPDPLALLRHELGTPLNAVIGYADAMRNETFGPVPSPYREQAELIHTAASHMQTLLGAMDAHTGFERLLALELLGRDDLESLLEDVVGLLRARAQAADLEIRAAVGKAPAGLRVRADRVALRQILINLIDNAVKFTGPGGVIEIAVGRESDEVRLTVESAGGPAPGSGRPGSGLGLHIVGALAKAMGGSLETDFHVDGEARAVVRLAAAEV
jgi:signal transduction histidine kinase